MNLLRLITRLVKDQTGATAIEYTFVASLISIAAASLLIQAGGSLVTIFTTVGNNL